jgi:ribosomal protein S18 acetylase RimI-like enzyme
MLTYRSFRNSDPPAIAALWRSRAAQSGPAQPILPDLLEQLVFAKLYFDYGGLILAHDDGRLVGLAHAGFGPNADESWISSETGVICAVVLDPNCRQAEVADGLLAHCEDYLRQRGAKVVLGGGLRPAAPFYIGLYGESELPGILDCDAAVREVLAAREYREIERTRLFRLDLDGFESLVDRQQMQIRRQMQVEVTFDAPTRTWWEASLFNEFDLTRFDLDVRGGGATVATATFRNMEPSGVTSAGPAVGLLDVAVDATCQRRGVATFLLSEAFRQFLRQGIVRVDAQVSENKVAAIGILRKLGMKETEQGGVWKKEL